MQENMECYNSGWQDGFVYALDMVLEAINRNYNEADREGDDVCSTCWKKLLTI